jgi:hypothetical protein
VNVSERQWIFDCRISLVWALGRYAPRAMAQCLRERHRG